jgi:hypothetical protein
MNVVGFMGGGHPTSCRNDRPIENLVMMRKDGLIDGRGPGKRLRVEILPADLSPRFINLSANRVETEIEKAHRQVSES